LEVIMARRSGHAKKIDNVHWTYGSFNFLALTAGTIASTLFPAQHLPETLLRTRGEWAAGLDGTKAPAVGVACTIGMIQVPEGTGTTVLWDPVVDGDAPWIWWDVFHLDHEEQVTDVIGGLGAFARRIIDVKAMRKLRNTELQVVCSNATIQGATGVNVAGSMRVLTGA